ncbi:Scn11a [Symbiodinium sp. CCMP2592]|nr:Scn11a [Symbiodinium sp. CCMP2592]
MVRLIGGALWTVAVLLQVRFLASEDLMFRVGNPLRPWNLFGEDLQNSEEFVQSALVLDSSVCFTAGGSVEAVWANFGELHRTGLWPAFVALRHVTAATWSVQQLVQVAEDSSWAPVRLRLRQPLELLPGDCLGWYRPAGSLHIAGAPTWQKPGWPPPLSSQAANAVAAGASCKEEPLPGQHFEFTEFHHVLHAISVEFVPAVHSFQRVALQKLGHDTDTTVTTTPRLRLDFTNEQLALLCWGKKKSAGLNGWKSAYDPVDCCLPLPLGSRPCFRAFVSYEACCKPEVAGPVFGVGLDTLEEVVSVGPAGITEGVLPFAMATFQDAVMSPRVQDVVETELEDWPIDGTHPEWKGFLQQQFSKQAALLQQLTLHLREETQAGIKLENKKLPAKEICH